MRCVSSGCPKSHRPCVRGQFLQAVYAAAERHNRQGERSCAHHHEHAIAFEQAPGETGTGSMWSKICERTGGTQGTGGEGTYGADAVFPPNST